MSTVDPIIDVETLLFFEKQPSALSIYISGSVHFRTIEKTVSLSKSL